MDIGTGRTRLVARGAVAGGAHARPGHGRRLVVRGVIVGAEGAARLAGRRMADRARGESGVHGAVACCPHPVERALTEAHGPS